MAVHEIAFRPWQSDNIPRRYCSGEAMLNDGKVRTVNYSIIEDGGFSGYRPGRRMVRDRARSQLGLQSGLQGRPALISRLIACCLRLLGRLFNGLCFLFLKCSDRRLGFRRSVWVWERRHVSCFDRLVPGFCSRWPAGFAVLITLAIAGTASAQDRRQNAPGEFDFYVLSLSWSPSFCEAASERGNERRSQAQCGGRPFSFVVHGLWPQYEHGFPEYCQRPSPRLDRDIMPSMLDLMPAPGLIFNEWDKHGTCSGLGARAYFETIRKARAAVKIPPEFLESVGTENGRPRRDRGCLRQGQSGPEHLGDRCDLRPERGSARCGSA